MNIKIRGIEVYHPDNVVNDEFYLEHFRKQGKEISGLLRALGTKDRYIINNNEENTLSMGVKAIDKLFKKENLTGREIDIIIYASQFPEYTMPTQASIIHGIIGGNPYAMCQDVNVNCIGMLVAYEMACRQLMSNKHFKKALVIGSDYASIHCKSDDENTYPLFGDCACAMIIEKTDEENIGFIDSIYESEATTIINNVTFPANGLSKSYKADDYSRKISWKAFDASFVQERILNSYHTLLRTNDLECSDVNKFCLSQFTNGFSIETAKSLNRPYEDFIYIGDIYGYTGTSSPFVALYEGLKTGRIKKGDKVFLWSIAIGWTTCAVLIQL